MVQLYWTQFDEETKLNGLMALKEMQIVLLDEKLEEMDRIIIKLPTLINPDFTDIISMWQIAFDVASILFESEDERVCIFLHNNQAKQIDKANKTQKNCHWYPTRNIILSKSLIGINWSDVSLDQILSMIKSHSIEDLFELENMASTKSVKLFLDEIGKKDFTFIGDTTARIFHEKDCSLLEKTSKSRIVGLGAKPKSTWLPCPNCKPKKGKAKKKKKKKDNELNKHCSTELWSAWEEKLKQFSLQNGISKTEAIGRQLKMLCEEYGIYADYQHDTISIITVSGEWFFNFSASPIVLYHKNYSSNDGFHMQDKTFSTPLQTIAYIQKHDLKNMKKRLLGSPEHRLLKAVENANEPLEFEQYLN